MTVVPSKKRKREDGKTVSDKTVVVHVFQRGDEVRSALNLSQPPEALKSSQYILLPPNNQH